MTNKSTHVHQQLATLLNTTHSLGVFVEQALATLLQGKKLSNYYLAIHDIESHILSFPYTHGKSEFEQACALHSVNSPLKVVIQKQQALTVRTDEYLRSCDDISSITDPPSLWVGLPLVKGSDVFAVLVFTASSDSQLSELETTGPFLESIPELLSPYLVTKIRMDSLEESEQRFRRFVETSIDITFQVNGDGIIDYVSSNIEARFGIDSQTLIGRNISTITSKNQGHKLKEGLRTISEGKTIRNLTINIQRSAGEIIPMEVSARPIIVGDKIIGAQGTVRDITERNRAQQEIERLAFFPLANPMPVVEVDLDGVPGYINPAGIQLLDRMDLDRSQVSQILPKTFKTDITAARSDQGQIPSREVSLEGMHLLWSAFFLQNQNLLHYYATDITNLKKTEIELISAKERALKNEEVKTLFLANMSHEIRTPLNSILGFTELIEEEVKDKFDEHLEAYFETIYMSGKRLWQTVHHILDISQIETGTFELKTESIDLSKIVKDLGASFNSVAKAKDLELKINVPAMDIHIISDEYCATQAISNLIDNAIKYTNSGYISLDIEVVEDAVKITIKDTGIGMSKEYQDMVFDVFSQESTGYTKNFQGMGLGLALAHRYLSLINGNLHFESEQDVGSKFTIHFPGSAEPAKTDQIAEPLQAEPTARPLDAALDSRINILVVEDDPNSQKLASFTLSKDYDLHFAESVADSKKMLEAHDVQMILLDLSLRGDEDGLDLARFLRGEAKWNKIPIVALTAHAFTSDRDRCMEAGCSDFMTKPFRLAELKETIQRLI
ncbi:MAG: PAS domain S-box protein [Candidatus Marinimicrobia bacterium]|nr:PAS domain S-box protein [Candidatus Neomarinimicrobiota bacterium]